MLVFKVQKAGEVALKLEWRGEELCGMEEAWDTVTGLWDGPRSDLESDLTRVERDGEETAQV